MKGGFSSYLLSHVVACSVEGTVQGWEAEWSLCGGELTRQNCTQCVSSLCCKDPLKWLPVVSDVTGPIVCGRAHHFGADILYLVAKHSSSVSYTHVGQIQTLSWETFWQFFFSLISSIYFCSRLFSFSPTQSSHTGSGDLFP